MRMTFLSLILALILALLFPMSASASIQTEIDIGAECNLEILYTADEKGFENLEIEIFRVGQISAGCEFSLDGDFADYKVDIENITTQDEWNTVANTLSSYAVADDITPTAVGKTDSNGRVYFENLRVGLYLILGVGAEREKEIFTFETFLASLPNEGENGNPNYNITAYPKHSSYIPEPDLISFKVLKLWKDGSNENRPEKVDIDIFRNGTLENSVELSSKNNWSYIWDAEDDGSVWTVVERNIAKDYTVEISENTRVFTVTNTYIAPPDVPQTGDTTTLWHYVLLMFLAGSVMVILAVKNRRVDNI